jgi:glycogen synthase
VTVQMQVLRLCSVFALPPGANLERAAGFDPLGGMQNHTAELTRALDAKGVRQTVITAFRPGAPALERTGSTEIHRLGLPLRRLRQLYSVAALPLVAKSARRADVIHVHQGEDLAVIPLGLLARRLGRAPIVITLHCSVNHTFEPSTASQHVVKRIGAPIERRGIRTAQGVIVLSTRLRAKLVAQGIGPERIHLIPSGVNSRRFEGEKADPLPHLGRPRVLFVGRLVAQKNPLGLVRAAEHIDPRASIVLVGDGPHRRMIENEMARSNARVHLTGLVPREDIPAYLTNADVLVLPSSYEELGSVMIEAMRAGLPIVATKTGGIPDIVEDGRNGLLVPPGDSRALARAINRVLEDRSFAARLGREGLRRSQRFEWSQLTDEVLATYESARGRDH